MGILSELLQLGRLRAERAGLDYAGALTPAEAWQVLQLAPGARLVDVRTHAELDWVGRVPGAVEVEWNFYPGGVPNPHFLEQLRRQVDREALVLFLCRSGGRSSFAAALAAEAGYCSAYNVLEGFEGDRDAKSQRGKVGGWRRAGLPWLQS